MIRLERGHTNLDGVSTIFLKSSSFMGFLFCLMQFSLISHFSELYLTKSFNDVPLSIWWNLYLAASDAVPLVVLSRQLSDSWAGPFD